MGERKGRGRLGVVVALALLASAALTLAAGCGGSGKSGGSTSTSAARQVVQVQHTGGGADRWAYARARFHEMCAGCHTLRAAGAYGPRIDLDRDGGVSRTFARHVILDGEPGMPAWRGVISRRELEELVSYVSTVARRDLRGENNWHWQILLRWEGENWRPERAR